jgi:phage-related protein
METDSQSPKLKTRSRPIIDDEDSSTTFTSRQMQMNKTPRKQTNIEDEITVDPIPPQSSTQIKNDQPISYMQEVFNRWATPEAKVQYELDAAKL